MELVAVKFKTMSNPLLPITEVNDVPLLLWTLASIIAAGAPALVLVKTRRV